MRRKRISRPSVVGKTMSALCSVESSASAFIADKGWVLRTPLADGCGTTGARLRHLSGGGLAKCESFWQCPLRPARTETHGFRYVLYLSAYDVFSSSGSGRPQKSRRRFDEASRTARALFHGDRTNVYLLSPSPSASGKSERLDRQVEQLELRLEDPGEQPERERAGDAERPKTEPKKPARLRRRYPRPPAAPNFSACTMPEASSMITNCPAATFRTVSICPFGQRISRSAVVFGPSP